MTKPVSSVQSVERALNIIEILQDLPNGLGVTELSHRLDVSKSTAHRLLMSLYNKGFVQQDLQTEKYYLGLKFIELGQVVTDNLDIRKVASPYLRQLTETTGETAHLAIMDKNEIVYIDKLESSATIRMFSNIGKRAPIHCTGIGKAIFAFLEDQQIEQIIKETGLKKYTEKTRTTREEMLKDIQEIRLRGYSIDDEEHEMGIKCSAAPIFNHKHEVVAGISVAGPIMRVTEEKLEMMAEEVLKVSTEISRLLGAK
ncbi:IclR family transcriptional regulator [Planococcus rifietoensis]|uniref:Glycerol operon regulatory protein n=1 Tax=Planococcus rifietoensis TaxID=200991 RepID=A0A0U2N712_9BACL|nr:IclR family transcriptional regulator [Planococcus rifietoensis]ALS76441.1 IclR family transcriptional regulator [Planococcus rifietoensis]